ncbi:MAG: PEP-CTERM sorting domain-containing protein [Verrucomicrobiota bacterium JB023]|nr:PEP-CTERM sorting domain-containing protein [Verrucomicrobiota bacterium JB023]
MIAKISLPIFALLAAASPGGAALIDFLDDTSNLVPNEFSSLTVSGGEVSMLSAEASVDRVIDWMFDGTTRLGLTQEGLVEVIPTAQVQDGMWGLWGVFYDGTNYLNEVEMLSFTDSADTVNLTVPDFAPAGADNYVLRFRVNEAVGDGFTFTQISATPVPEPSFVALLAVGGLLGLRRKR